MAEKDKGSEEIPSGLTTRAINRLLSALSNDRRVLECKAAAKAKRRADLGFFVRSSGQPFFRRDRNPSVAGFAPALILEGDWDSARIIRASDARAARVSPGGFSAACGVDLSQVDDIDEFLRRLLTQFGSVTIAPQFSANLSRSVPFLRADQATLAKAPVGHDYDGRDSTVCVIDMGCDYAHRNFRKGANLAQSRLTYLVVMDQNGTPTPYDKATIEHWIAGTAASPYDPHSRDFNCVEDSSIAGTHGTLVLDIAAGNGNGTGIKGMAPGADLVFMQVFVSQVNPTSAGGGRRYVSGDSIYNAALAAKNLLDLDGAGPPTVFSVSLGTNDGPHDSADHGANDWNTKMEALFAGKQGRALIWSAGNQFRGNLHVAGTLSRSTDPGSGQVTDKTVALMDVRVPAGDKRLNDITVWIDKPAAVTLSAQAQLLEYKGQPAGYAPVWQNAGPLVDHRPGNPVPTPRGAGTLGAPAQYGTGALYKTSVSLLPPPSRTGAVAADDKRWETWRIKLTGASAADYTTPLHAWIERDDGDQVFFRPIKETGIEANCRVEPLGTLSANAAGVASAIVVGAVGTATYEPGTPVNSPGVGAIMPFSSAGPTRDGRKRPDVCAPGEIITGAKSLGDPVANGTGYGRADLTAMSGTSMAAPHVAGLVALLFDKITRTTGQYPDPEGVRQALIAAARSNIPGSTNPQWDPQRGWGCVDAVELLR